MVNHRELTATMIDSRGFLNAKKLAETQVLLPPGPRIAFAGGRTTRSSTDLGYDKMRAKHLEKVLSERCRLEGRGAHCRLLGGQS